MNERYDIHGNVFLVKAILQDGTVLGHEVWEDPKSYEEIEGELQIIRTKLFDKPPRGKRIAEIAELNAKISAAHAELATLTKDIREAEAAGKERLAKLAQHEQLKRLEDFMDGKITHYVIADYGPPNIVALAEANVEQFDKHLRLLCLFGTPGRTLEWKLNRYSDGSGCYYYVFPCCGIEEAKEKLGRIFSDHFAGKSVDSDKVSPRRDWIDAAEKAGITVPDEYRSVVEKRESKERAMRIKELEDKIAELKKTL